MWTVIDLFSGAGGMSYGFFRHGRFRIVGAVDAELGKPSAPPGALQCNRTYQANIGVRPLAADLRHLAPTAIRQTFLAPAAPLTVLLAAPPCTGFSRTIPQNHLADDPRNALVGRLALYAAALQPAIVLVENVRELVNGNFRIHAQALGEQLTALGYRVAASVHRLDRYGLPQRRERSLIMAVKAPLPLYTLDDLWQGYTVAAAATNVRRAIGNLPPVRAGQIALDDPWHTAPRLSEHNLRRLRAIPANGGSWRALANQPASAGLLTPAMQRAATRQDFSSHPDIYGRLWWDRPAVTIKRECSHLGNGRYAHPEQDRLCTIRELAVLQGFPADYQFGPASQANIYRQIGDAVPPLISYQLAHLCAWILSGIRPAISELVLPGTSLRPPDLLPTPAPPDPQLPLPLFADHRL